MKRPDLEDYPERPIDTCPCEGPGRPVRVNDKIEYLPPWCSEHNPKETNRD